MSDTAPELTHLNGDNLMKTLRALADDIGPRPPGSPAEAQARDYLKGVLEEAGIDDSETLAFDAWRTWGWNVIPSVIAGLVVNLLGWRGGNLSRVGGLLAELSVLELQNGIKSRPQILEPFYPKGASGTLLAKIAPSGEIRNRVVLIGHTDTNKHRPTFGAAQKKLMLPSGMLLMGAMIANIVALLGRDSKFDKQARRLQLGVAGILGYALFTFLRDEMGGFVDGANDNASAVACTLGLGLQALATPLAQTEIWLAFTGAEEVGLLGLRKLLDVYGDTLQDAYFIDFELVGAGQIAYVTHHSGFDYFSGYTPDMESLSVARQAAALTPDLGVIGKDVVINEEVRALRQRGFKGICLVGLDEAGWLKNWHQYSDNSQNIEPDSLETAARFAWQMIQVIDSQ